VGKQGNLFDLFIIKRLHAFINQSTGDQTGIS